MLKMVAFLCCAWFAIVGLGWRLADTRIQLCEGRNSYGDAIAGSPSCIIRATAARDDILLAGLIVALVALLAGLLLARRNSGSVRTRGRREAGAHARRAPLLSTENVQDAL